MSRSVVIQDTAALPCLLFEFDKLLESRRGLSSTVDICLPLVCLLMFCWFWFNDVSRSSQLELRRWHLIHRYFQHLHDWSEEEEAIEVSEMYTHCRSSDFRYPAYQEEVQAKSKDFVEKRAGELVHLPGGYLHAGWEEIWTVKWLIYGASFLLACQAALRLSCYILRLNDPSLLRFYQKLKNQLESKDSVLCARKLGKKDLLLKLGRHVVLSVLKGNRFYAMGWMEMGILFLFVICLILQLAQMARRLMPPAIPRPPLAADVSMQRDYALTAKHRSFLLFYVVYLVVLSLSVTAFTSYTMLKGDF